MTFIPCIGPEPKVDENYAVLDETDDYLVVSKSGNCPVHPGGRYTEHNLFNILKRDLGQEFHPIFRLDRETSGIVVFAKDRNKVFELSKQIHGKKYVAIVHGKIDKPTRIDMPIGEKKSDLVLWKMTVVSDGKPSVTNVIPVKSNSNFSIIQLSLETGRQHQIRTHLSWFGHPIVGDKIYGDSEEHFIEYLKGEPCRLLLPRHALHMESICVGDKEYFTKMPNDMSDFVANYF